MRAAPRALHAVGDEGLQLIAWRAGVEPAGRAIASRGARQRGDLGEIADIEDGQPWDVYRSPPYAIGLGGDERLVVIVHVRVVPGRRAVAWRRARKRVDRAADGLAQPRQRYWMREAPLTGRERAGRQPGSGRGRARRADHYHAGRECDTRRPSQYRQ